MNTPPPSEELLALAADIGKQADNFGTISKAIEKLSASAQEIGKSWSGSCLGYHSRVYYRDFKRPLPGDRFSQEWGLMQVYANDGSSDHWAEQPFDAVVQYITEQAGSGGQDIGGPFDCPVAG